jgi:thioredoxin 1
MSSLISVDDNNFAIEVLASTLPVLVDFSAVWCGPCQRQLPVLEKFAAENIDRVKICKVDVDESPALSAKFGIRGVPSIILFKAGKQIDMKVGLVSSVALDNLLLEKVGS